MFRMQQWIGLDLLYERGSFRGRLGQAFGCMCRILPGEDPISKGSYGAHVSA